MFCFYWDRFVADVDTLKPELKDSVAKFMAFVHKSVNEMSVTYLQVNFYIKHLIFFMKIVFLFCILER